jgi:hypothetical protein
MQNDLMVISNLTWLDKWESIDISYFSPRSNIWPYRNLVIKSCFFTLVMSSKILRLKCMMSLICDNRVTLNPKSPYQTPRLRATEASSPRCLGLRLS